MMASIMSHGSPVILLHRIHNNGPALLNNFLTYWYSVLALLLHVFNEQNNYQEELLQP